MKASFSCLERLFLKQYCTQHILYVSNTNLVSFVAILMLCVCSVVRKLSNEGLAKERTTEGGGQGLKDQDPLSTYTNTRTLSRIQLLILKLLNPLQEVTFSKQFSRN